MKKENLNKYVFTKYELVTLNVRKEQLLSGTCVADWQRTGFTSHQQAMYRSRTSQNSFSQGFRSIEGDQSVQEMGRGTKVIDCRKLELLGDIFCIFSKRITNINREIPAFFPEDLRSS